MWDRPSRISSNRTITLSSQWGLQSLFTNVWYCRQRIWPPGEVLHRSDLSDAEAERHGAQLVAGHGPHGSRQRRVNIFQGKKQIDEMHAVHVMNEVKRFREA